MTFERKNLPIYIRLAAFVLCMLFAVQMQVLVFADTEAQNAEVSEEVAEEFSEEENGPHAMPLTYYDTQTFFDFAGVESEALESGYAMAVNLDTGSVMYEKNPDVIVFPASTVKIMTAILVFENVPDLDTVVYASENAVRISSGTRINPTKPIKAGEGFTVRELLYGLLITGANDCANVLAEYVGGSVEGFCDMMNARAKELGAVNTTFKNPTGLHDPEMTTTVRDLALIAGHAFYINELVEISGTTNYTLEATNLTPERRYLYNRNRMIRRVENEQDYFYKGTLGLSAGSTPEGGNCVVAAAQRDGLSYLTVVMNGGGNDKENFAYKDTLTLLNVCFNGFSVQKVVTAGVGIRGQIDVELAANTDQITLHAAQDVSALLPNDLDIEQDITLDSHVLQDAKAPIAEGQVFGELLVKYKDSVVLGKTDLVSSVSVERSNFLYFMSLLGRFFKSRWFITAFISAVVLFIGYCFLYYKAKKRQRRYRR